MLISLFILLIATLFYLLVLLYLGRGVARLQNQPRSKAQPFVTVIVCARNEERNLPQCIAALSAQMYPSQKTEIILVNDRSEDGSPQIMKAAADKDSRFRYLAITDRLKDFAPKKRAIDYAIRSSNPQSELILLTDADGRPGPQWISTVASFFSPQTDMVIGYAPYTVKPAGHRTKKILALEYMSHAAIAAATTGLRYPVTCVGTNMAYRKSLYFEAGGFGPFKNQVSGDDDLFLSHIREQHKYHIGYAADAGALVYNDPPRLWSKFIHQRMRYASKGFKYALQVTLGLIAYFLFNVLFIGLVPLAVLVGAKGLLVYGLSLTLKMFAEYLFLRRAGQLLHDKRHLHMLIPASLLHIPYVVVFAILGQLDYFKWAESTAESGVLSKEPQ